MGQRFYFGNVIKTLLLFAAVAGVQQSFAQNPGGVSANLKLWLKADAGVTGTTTVTAWADQSGNSNNASAAGVGVAATAPALTPASMNFNPAITLSAANGTSYRYLKTSSNPVTNDMSLIAVYKSTQNAGSTLITTSPSILSGEVTTVVTDYGLSFTGGKVAAKMDSASNVQTACAVNDTHDGNTFDVTSATSTNTNIPFIAVATRLRATGATGQVGICIFPINGPLADGAVNLYTNGTSVGSLAIRGRNALNAPNGLGIGNGSSGAVSQQFVGDISEAIVYDGVLSGTNRQRIESYLGVKYGITLPNNYVASDGATTIYTVSGYGNNIAGIGRDDNSGLYQKQGTSASTTAQVVMSLGTIATDNASNANTISADINYLVWGDDGTAGNTVVTNLTSVTSRLSKWYRLQNTGASKTTTVYVPASFFSGSLTHYIITNSTASTSGATATVVPTATTTINGVSYNAVSITWTGATATFFTFGESTVVPGGVAGLTSWFKADVGTNTTTNGAAVTTWNNQISGSAVTSLTQATATRQPTYKTALWNFNPGISFDGLTGANGDMLQNTSLTNVTQIFSTNDSNSFFGVLNIEGSGGSTGTAAPVYFQVSAGGQAANSKFSLEGKDLLYPIGSNRALPGTTPISLTNTTPSIVSAYTVPLTAAYAVDGGTPVTGAYTGNFGVNSPTSNPTYMVGAFLFGGAAGTYDYFMKGNYTEILTYSGVNLSATQKQQVQSYLAVKYGKTLAANYLSSAGTTTYQVTGYANNIAGIGRDDQSSLYQKQSQSINTGNQVIMSLGSPTTTNQLNASTVTGDRQFLIWGDDGGTETFISDTAGAFPRRMTKWFKARSTAFTQSVKVMYPATAFAGYNAVYLLTNTSATTTGATLTPMTTTTFNGVSYYVTDYTFPTSATSYFTFVTAANIYYVKTSTADISVANNWTTDSSGATVTSPANFTTAANLFIINNSVGGANTTTLANPLTISGTDAKLFIMNYNTGSPSLSISAGGRLTVGTGAMVDFNGMNVTVRSTATGTGSIGQITGRLSNATNVTIERYMGAGRKWHLLAAPITGTQTIYSGWQEGGVTSNTGYGTYITNGTQAGGSGYDAAPADAYLPGLSSSIRVFSGATNSTLSTPSSTNATTLASNPAYFLFVRGDRTPASYSAYQAQPTTLRINGTLIQGAVNQTLSASGAGFDVLRNPYPSPISLAAATNPPASIYLWDPAYGQYFGGYILYTRSGSAGSYAYNTVATNPTYGTTLSVIQSGQAFIAARAGAATFTVNEAQKTTSLLNALKTTNLPVGVTSGIIIRVKSLEGNDLKERDVTDVRFDNSYSNALAYGEDVPKTGNFGENLSFYRGGEWIAIEKMAQPATTDTLFVQLWKTSAAQYTFEIEAGGLPAGIQPYLLDNNTNTQTPLNLAGIVNYTFTSNGANIDLNRFKIVFSNSITLPVTVTDITAYKQNGAVNVDWTVINEDDIASYEVEKSTDGSSFSRFATAKPTNEIFEHSYSATDKQPAAGANYYRVKSLGVNGLVKYSRTVKLDFGSGKPDFSVYPVPVKDNNIGLDFTNLTAGEYTVSVYSGDGRLIRSKQVSISATGTSTQTIELPKNRPAGIYLIKLDGGDMNISKKISVE